MLLNKVKQTQRIRLVNTESPISLSQPGFNNSDCPRDIHEKERLISVSLLLLFYYY